LNFGAKKPRHRRRKPLCNPTRQLLRIAKTVNNIIKGLIAGTIFGIVSNIPMLFMQFEDRTKAMTASFISRFAIGFMIFNLELAYSELA